MRDKQQFRGAVALLLTICAIHAAVVWITAGPKMHDFEKGGHHHRNAVDIRQGE